MFCVLPLDIREAVLDGRTIPRMSDVEVVSATAKTRAARLLLVWHDEMLARTDIRLVCQQTLAILKRRHAPTEQLDVRRHTDVRAAVPDQIASMVAHTLHLKQPKRQTQ